MKKQLLLVLLLLPVCAAFSQSMIGHTRSVVRTHLKRYIRQHNFTNSKIEERADTMLLNVKEKDLAAVEFRYIFNANRWCIAEQKTTCCEQCMSTLMTDILGSKRFEWNKINDSTYISKFSKKRLIKVTQTNETKRVDIHKIKWSRQQYETLLAAR